MIYNTLIVPIAWHPQGHTVYQQHLRLLLSNISVSEPFEYVLVLCVVEETVPAKLVDTVNQCVTDVFSEYPVLTLYNNCVEDPALYDEISSRNTILGINYFGTVAYFTTTPDFTWNCACARVFWLVGKSTKYDRLSLLYYLSQHQTAFSHLTYSFDPQYCTQGQDPYEQGQCTLDAIWYPNSPGSVDYRAWATQYTNQMGDVQLSEDQYHGFIYDLEIYQSHCCEIVTETFFDQPWFLTEKIHRSIALGYPFLTLGDHFSSHLQSLGYLTFNDLLDQQPLIQGQPGYLQMSCKKLATLIRKFCVSCANPEFEQQVQARIAHNKKIFETQVTESIAQISMHIPAFADIIEHKSWAHVGKTPPLC